MLERACVLQTAQATVYERQIRYMKVLITGINGYIGSHVADKFNNEGYEVYGVDRFVGNGKYPTDVFDITREDMAEYLGELSPDVVINCAGQANVPNSIAHPLDDLQENAVLVHGLLFALQEAGLKDTRFIQLSSAAVYGNPSSLPIKEEAERKPLSPYALHKVMAEDVCRYFHDNCGMDTRVLRIFSVYGPGLRKQIFWDLYQKVKKTGRLSLIGTGNESRDYIYIDDLTEVICMAATSTDRQPVWNVAAGREVYIREVADIYARKLGLPADKIEFSGQVRAGDPLNWRADISIIRSLGFEPKVDMEEGISRYVDWIEHLD